MQFVPQYELVIKYTDGRVVLYDVFPTYAEAYDAAVNVAASGLPDRETVIAFQIINSFKNVAAKEVVAGA